MNLLFNLILSGLSSLFQWLAYRKQKSRPLTDKQKKQLGHLAAKMQHYLQVTSDLGVVPKLDDESILDNE